MLFFWGLGDILLHIDRTVFIATSIPICIGAGFYLYCVINPIWNPKSPYRTPFSGVIWYILRNLHRNPYYNLFCGKVVRPAMELRQEQSAMKKSKGRMNRDVRAIHWLVDKINGSNETETFVLAIPGSFNQEWGRDVWKAVMKGDLSTSTVGPQTKQTRPHPSIPSPHEGTTVYDLCKCVRYCFETYSKDRDFMDTKERRRRMRGWVETAASLVCCTEVELGSFGEVGEVLSELGDKERTSDPLTIRSNPLFTVRWTCLSLVAIWKMLDGNMLQEPAKFALDRIARFQTEYGGPDTMALTAAQNIDDYLKKAWASAVDLHLAFEPWSQKRTESEIRGILTNREGSILELERIAIEVVGVEDVDWRISLLVDTMDKATYKLIRHLPGVSLSKLEPAAPISTSESLVEANPVPSQLIFPGLHIQSLCGLGQGLRDIIEGRNTERHEETLKRLETLRETSVAVREVDYLMKRQLWRLLDLRDGSGLGFTIELLFLALRQLSPASLSDELKKDLYAGTFRAIASNWEKSNNSVGTQRILLDLLCDLVIRRRGVFSDFSYPPYIVDLLLDLVGTSGTKRGMPSPRPWMPRLYRRKRLESRAHSYSAFPSSVRGRTAIIL
jgi:hypothetical protein